MSEGSSLEVFLIQTTQSHSVRTLSLSLSLLKKEDTVVCRTGNFCDKKGSHFSTNLIWIRF